MFSDFPNNFSEKIVDYDAPVGGIGEPEGKLTDLSYDGSTENNFMKGGLGQLIDGVYGENGFDPEDSKAEGLYIHF